jgi:hypothetical protein
VIKFHGVLKMFEIIFILFVSWDKLCIPTGTLRNKVLIVMIIFIPVFMHRLDRVPVRRVLVPKSGPMYGHFSGLLLPGPEDSP